MLGIFLSAEFIHTVQIRGVFSHYTMTHIAQGVIIFFFSGIPIYLVMPLVISEELAWRKQWWEANESV